MKTVGELKEMIKDLPDDMKLVMYKSNMETSGYQNSVYTSVEDMVSKKKHTYDRFDGISYDYEVYIGNKNNENGEKCLKIY